MRDGRSPRDWTIDNLRKHAVEVMSDQIREAARHRLLETYTSVTFKRGEYVSEETARAAMEQAIADIGHRFSYGTLVTTNNVDYGVVATVYVYWGNAHDAD